MAQTIGFIGLGIMGRPMAHNLVKAGYSLIVHDINRAPVKELVGVGAVEADSARSVASQVNLIITMLPDSPEVREVVLGSGGVIEGVRPGAILVDMSTISPVVTVEIGAALREKGVAALDAPVSGGEKGAIEATLSIMVGGPKEAFERVLPIFQVLGKNIVHLGNGGAGQITKACNQIVVALTIEAVSEALVLAAKAGVDPARVREVLLGGFAQSRILDLHGQRMLSRNFAPGFKIRLHHKDLGIALATGKSSGVPLPVTSLVHEMFGALRAAGREELDHSALVTLIEDLAKAQVKSS